jgi:hypothetical protein
MSALAGTDAGTGISQKRIFGRLLLAGRINVHHQPTLILWSRLASQWGHPGHIGLTGQNVDIVLRSCLAGKSQKKISR